MISAIENAKVASIGKELAKMSKAVGLIEDRSALVRSISDNTKLLSEEVTKDSKDEEMVSLITDDLAVLKEHLNAIEADLIVSLTPKDEADDR
jgi:protein subunit release factor A